MKFLVFILTYPFIWILSRFPMSFLYIISDFFYFLMYYVLGYRKKIVFDNIKTAFPEKTDKEINSISKKFFSHFTDLIFESIKSFSISKENLTKRYTYENVEVINNLAEKGKSIVLMGAHHNNWEWSFGLPLQVNIDCYGTYTKIQNNYFEKVIKSSRMRFGYDGVPTAEFIKAIGKKVKDKNQSLYIMLSDQSPQLHRTKYWSNFLGEFVPVHTGAETLSKKYHFAIINMSVLKVKRGYYKTKFTLITENASDYKDFEITDKYLKLTEKNIKKQPQFYLWSHKRFKHKGKYNEWLLSKKKV